MSDRIPESSFVRASASTYTPRRTEPRNPFATGLAWAWVLGFVLALALIVIKWLVVLNAENGLDIEVAALMDSWTVDLLRLGFVALFAHLCAKTVLWRAP